jgi:hypothetical protein
MNLQNFQPDQFPGVFEYVGLENDTCVNENKKNRICSIVILDSNVFILKRNFFEQLFARFKRNRESGTINRFFYHVIIK